MAKNRKNERKRSKKTGLPPGSLVHIGTKKMDKIRISKLKYSEDCFEEKEIDTKDIDNLNSQIDTVTWINVDGIDDVDTLGRIGIKFGVHPLVMEDILNTNQRPKVEDFCGYTYIVVKLLSYDNNLSEFTTEQQSFILAENLLISFNERESEIFNPVRERITQGIGRIKKMGADYLLYALLDIIVDNYFNVLEELEATIEDVENELISKPSESTLQNIYKLKSQIMFFNKSVRPLREMLGFLERGESTLIKESTDIYIRDLYDHVIQIVDTTENFRDILSGMLDIYLSSVSNKMNEVMKVLTIISTVFIPLSFIVGLYGMNIKNMPEYEWNYMYPVLWLVMISIVVSMLVFFKKKKWL